MKFINKSVAYFIFIALFSIFAFTAPIPTKVRTPICPDKELVWDGGNHSGADFVIASGTKSWLCDAVNWASSFQSYGTFMCFGSGKMCKVRIQYCYDPALGESDPNPSIQDVIDELCDHYIDSWPQHLFLFSSFTFTKNGIEVTVTIIQKS